MPPFPGFCGQAFGGIGTDTLLPFFYIFLKINSLSILFHVQNVFSLLRFQTSLRRRASTAEVMKRGSLRKTKVNERIHIEFEASVAGFSRSEAIRNSSPACAIAQFRLDLHFHPRVILPFHPPAICTTGSPRCPMPWQPQEHPDPMTTSPSHPPCITPARRCAGFALAQNLKKSVFYSILR